jgi:hypothetical protein
VTGDMYRAGEVLDQKIRRLTRENDAKERELFPLDQESEEEEYVYTSSFPGSHVARIQMAGSNPNSPYYGLPPESITWDRSPPNLKYMEMRRQDEIETRKAYRAPPFGKKSHTPLPPWIVLEFGNDWWKLDRCCCARTERQLCTNKSEWKIGSAKDGRWLDCECRIDICSACWPRGWRKECKK